MSAPATEHDREPTIATALMQSSDRLPAPRTHSPTGICPRCIVSPANAKSAKAFGHSGSSGVTNLTPKAAAQCFDELARAKGLRAYDFHLANMWWFTLASQQAQAGDMALMNKLAAR